MTLLEVSFAGAVCVIAVVMIRIIALNRLPKQTFVVLWEIALVRLILPFKIPSVLSIYTLIGQIRSMPAFLEAEADKAALAISRESFGIVQGMRGMEYSASRQATVNPLSVSVCFVVWCVGMLLLAVFFMRSYLHCRLLFRTALPVRNTCAEQWIKEHPLRRRILIRQSDRIATPLTYGIFHPVILMPKQTDWKNTGQLQYIFAHEYEHICRFDALTKRMVLYALCIHWFNPFVWVMFFLCNRDMELACDESVIRQFGDRARSAYSFVLIGMAERNSGLMPFCNHFSKNAVEERINAIMKTKQMTMITFLSACLIVLVTVCLFATSAVTSADSNMEDASVVSVPETNTNMDTNAYVNTYTNTNGIAADKKEPMTIVHESAAILRYEDGASYIHDILTNKTDSTIVETQYCMLAYNENGSPLKLYWNFLDSGAECSFENIVRTKTNILSDQTEKYRGGWSLYDGEIMKDFPRVGNGEASQAAYALLCLKQVVFEDGTVWDNPDYEDWFEAYAGKEIEIDELQNYYPYEYKIGSEQET